MLMDIEAFLRLKTLESCAISPDGRWIACCVREADISDDSNGSSIWVVPAAGGEPKRLTWAKGTNQKPAWSPDSRRLVFASDRSGKLQVYVIDIAGGEPKQVTSEGADGRVGWCPD